MPQNNMTSHSASVATGLLYERFTNRRCIIAEADEVLEYA